MRAALDKLLAAKPEHVRGNVLLGQLQLYELRQKGETDPAAWKTARRPIQIANRADPNDPIPLYAYFQSFLIERTRPSDMAIKGLERAFVLTPENLNLRSAYAVSLAHLGRFEPAINLAKTVAFDPHDNGRGDALLKRIETMRDRGTGPQQTPEDDSD
jgi:tetratricopeptide (TPR) repeat protein